MKFCKNIDNVKWHGLILLSDFMRRASLLKNLLLIFALVAAVDARADSAAPIVIDWSKGWAQDTEASCGAFTFTNMKDRHSYSLYVRGTTSGTCSFKADGLTFHFPSNHGAVIAGTTTLYSFERFGADVLVAWTPGY